MAADEHELPFAGLAAQAQAVRDRAVSPRELVELTLRRIEALDPTLNAFRVVLAEKALAEADQAAARVGAGDDRPLLGVPVAIKDDTDVAGEVTTMGVDALDPPAPRDAEIVRRLRAAGAIVVGKTNVPQLLAHPFTENPAFGATRNPHDPLRTPGGSSGGSAAAVAAGLVGGAQGSDGAGSIRLPASHCGIFGIKPARGRISLAPLAEAWHGCSVTGPITRRVRDAALFLDVSHGALPGDRDPAPAPAGSFLAATEREPGRLRIALSFGLPKGLVVRVHPEVRRRTEEMADTLRGLGHEVVEADPDYGEVALNATARVVAGIRDDARRFEPPIRIERRLRRRAMVGRAITAPVLAYARRDEARLAGRVNAVFDRVDVVLTPVTPRPPGLVGRFEGTGDARTFLGDAEAVAFTAPWNAIGSPAASVPAGRSAEGLPIGVQLVGRPYDEATLLALAAQIERARPWHERRPALS